MAAAYPCVVQPSSKHIPMLYQLGYDFDAAMNEAGLSYSISDGSLLGALRHGGVIPWDDDIDVNLFCEEGSPCWGQLFTLDSPFRTLLRARGLELYTDMYPDHKRHMLKVYPTREGHYVGRNPDRYNYPNLDIFLMTRVRCNVSDQLQSGTWWQHIAAAKESEQKKADVSKAIGLYETDVWVYRTARPQRFSKGCSVLDVQFSFLMDSEAFPLRRIPFGPEAKAVELWAPRRAERVMVREIGLTWASHIFRTSHPHYLIEQNHLARGKEWEDAVAAAKASGQVPPEQPPLLPPFIHCHANLNEVPPHVRAWMARPAGPSHVEKRTTEEVMRAWTASHQAAAVAAPKAK